ncbi:MAG: CBS domain-containing protein [Pseudomonadota bacterium]|nr:CBS domain-containing protein [Pseudomonadota bacterium]
MKSRQVRDLMESDLALVSPDATLQEAARQMKEVECGFLPVGRDDAPEGIITDRDIVIRAVAAGKDPTREKVRDYMTGNVCACSETDTLEDAAGMMNQNSISRLVVKNDSGKVCGVLTFGRIIRSDTDRQEVGGIVEKAVGRAA